MLNLCRPRPSTGRGHWALRGGRGKERQSGNSPQRPRGPSETLHPLQASSCPGPRAALKSKLPDPLHRSDQTNAAPRAAQQQRGRSGAPLSLQSCEAPSESCLPSRSRCWQCVAYSLRDPLPENLTVLAPGWTSGKHSPPLVPHVCHPLPWEKSPYSVG